MSDKLCRKCKTEQPLSNFYRNASRSGGYEHWCKACKNEYWSRYYRERRERYAEYRRNAGENPGVFRRRASNAKADRERYPEKYRARNKVHNALRAGRLVKQPCRFCGETKVQAHHEDYSKPLDVIWVCFKCHIEQFHDKKVVA